MTESEDKIITQMEEFSRNAERAYWWMRNVDPDEAQRLGVSEKVESALSLLQKVDNITIDITITIKEKV